MITINTQNPANLLSEIKKEIREKKIETWDCDASGDFTHNPSQWKNKAWLRPSIPQSNNKIILTVVWPTNSLKEKSLSAVYHGRFIEMLSSHFPTKFTTIDSTMP